MYSVEIIRMNIPNPNAYRFKTRIWEESLTLYWCICISVAVTIVEIMGQVDRCHPAVTVYLH